MRPSTRPRSRPRLSRRLPVGPVALLALLAPTTVSGCGDPLGPGEGVEVNAERWERRGTSDYVFVLDRVCECLVTGPVQLSVIADDVVHAEALPGSSAPVGSNPDPEQFPTIDELFDQLRAAAAADPARFVVEYDPGLGYPRRADVDVSAQIADEELVFEVYGVILFEPLARGSPAPVHLLACRPWRNPPRTWSRSCSSVSTARRTARR